MKPISFDPLVDLAPLPFDRRHRELALHMKRRGLPWKPHVGCFVWDHQERIEADSPFPLRIYFILSLPRFIGIFGDEAAVARSLVWLPTWHQARLLAAQLSVAPQAVAGLFSRESTTAPGEDLLALYRLLLESLQNGSAAVV